MNEPKINSAVMDALQSQTFDHFIHETKPLNGMVVHKTQAGAPASIAAIGLALSSYPVGVERCFTSKASSVDERFKEDP